MAERFRITLARLSEDIPTADGMYTMLVAHEFFDALQFHPIEVRRR